MQSGKEIEFVLIWLESDFFSAMDVCKKGSCGEDPRARCEKMANGVRKCSCKSNDGSTLRYLDKKKRCCGESMR